MADFWNTVTGGAAQNGTWLGGLLPDFSLTEQATGGQGGSFLNNPAVYQAAGTTQQGYQNTVANNAAYSGAQQGLNQNPYAWTSPQVSANGQVKQNTNVANTPNPRPDNWSSMNPAQQTDFARSKGFTGPEDYLNNLNKNQGGAVQDMSAQVRNDINSGYNNYFASLDSILNNDLPAQQQAQLGIANAQGQQATNTLGLQQEQGLADLGVQRRQTEQGQAKNLQGLADDVRNQFKAGQIYLGAKGAGDSSAANQYSYAIAKMGNQGRGQIMQQGTEIQNQINDRETKLKSTYNTELNNIKSSVDQKVMEVANWFSQAQTQLKQAKASGQLSQGQDLANLSKQLLQTATQQMLATQQEASNRRSMLDQWALNNSTTINQAKQNIASTSNYQAPGITNPGINGQLSADAGGNVSYNRGAGYSNTANGNQDWLKKLYGTTA